MPATGSYAAGGALRHTAGVWLAHTLDLLAARQAAPRTTVILDIRSAAAVHNLIGPRDSLSRSLSGEIHHILHAALDTGVPGWTITRDDAARKFRLRCTRAVEGALNGAATVAS